MNKDEVKTLLKSHGLRATAPRVAVLMELAHASSPLSHSEMLENMGDADCDPATIYRNLVKLTEVGLARVVSKAEGMSRYAMAHGGDEDDEHHHPHFVCDDCGHVSCLPVDINLGAVMDKRWAESLKVATVQLHGECPECLEAKA